jgi:hypothetical protein
MTRSTSGGNRGLSVVQSGGGVSGSAIVFATSPGDVAQDGAGRNGVFTASLLKYMDSDLKLEDVFKKVTAEVRGNTNGNQKPWINASLTGDFYFISDAMRIANLQAQAKAAEERQKAELAKAADAARLAESDKTAAAKRDADAAKQAAAEALAAKTKAEAEAAALLAKAAKDTADAQATAAAAQKAAEEARAAVDALRLAAQNKGKLRVVSGSAGKVYIGGELLGDVGPETTLMADSLRVGTISLRFVAANGKNEEKSITITDKAYATVNFARSTDALGIAREKLAAKDADESGSLSFDWLMPNYVVRLDGVQVGLVKGDDGIMTVPDLAPNAYVMTVEIPGMGTWEKNIAVTRQAIIPVAKPVEYFLDSLFKEKAYAKKRYDEGLFWRVTSIVEFGLSAFGAGAAIFGAIDGPLSYSKYKEATTAYSASMARSDVNRDSQMIVWGTVIGLVSLTGGVLITMASPDPSGSEKQLKDIEEQIKLLHDDRVKK